MSDYKKKLEDLQQEAKKRVGKLDDQFGISDRVGEGVKSARETAKKGADTVKEGVDRLKKEAEKSETGKSAVRAAEDTYEAAEKTFKSAERTARDTAKKAWDASEPVREAAEETAGDVYETASKNAGDVYKEASKRAGEFFGETRRTVETTASRVTSALGIGISWTRTFDSAARAMRRTSNWVLESPGQAAATGASVVVGAGLGVVFTGLSSHWFFNSAVPAWSVKKLAGLFNDHLKNQESLIAEGKLSKADAEKLKFERDISKYVGAPLLGAFSFASGAVMMTNVINPKTITGAPIDWIIGGNPLLEGVWFFGNGMVCFKTSYDLFMISLGDDADVQRVVKEIKGLLPEAVTS
ncbi:MAG: hypothetical protein DWQ47_07810 [Acidobacteria bacterium]|nr:MAG: hypothetical protein DWQ32_15910 [Acidobacteriota bacterium]REJ99176.1 MAG: hypothetical protein DWQ38_14065 [Acidobacteriota bacterium]REK16103.1 MAG: hypothetical protein DWQ43_03620 [Acidobacteriota bacterium]REK43784.1 MAG: hypothetical protein DWQ47_07810 [Acidobacteriota bacterium]